MHLSGEHKEEEKLPRAEWAIVLFKRRQKKDVKEVNHKIVTKKIKGKVKENSLFKMYFNLFLVGFFFNFFLLLQKLKTKGYISQYICNKVLQINFSSIKQMYSLTA